MDKLWKGIFYCELLIGGQLMEVFDPTRRFLDVGQGIGSASPRVRTCKYSLEYRPQFRVIGVPRRILEDNRAGMGGY